jgi:hypothetical protein
MKKFLRGMLVVGIITVAGISGMVFAGEKANVVVTDSAGKELVVKSVTLTSGSSTVASGLGTATHALFMPSTTSTGTNTATFEYFMRMTAQEIHQQVAMLVRVLSGALHKEHTKCDF